MCEGIVIEAHAILELRDDIVLATGTRYELLEWLMHNCKIVMTDKIKNHWELKLGIKGDVVFDWLEQKNHEKCVHELKNIKKVHRDIKKKIKEFGLTKEPFVEHYIDCANTTTKPRYILAEDIPFYDPKAAKAGAEKKQEIKNNKSGELPKFLEKNLNITVSNVVSCSRTVGDHEEECLSERDNSNCKLL